MNKDRRKLMKRHSKEHKSDQLKHLKAEIQKEQRIAYWKYIENMIFDIQIPD